MTETQRATPSRGGETTAPAASVLATHDRTNLVIALASLIHNASRDSAELGVLVEDAWPHSMRQRPLARRAYRICYSR